MKITSKLIELRPKDSSSAAVKEAIARVTELRAAIAERVETLKGSMGNALLLTSPKAAQDHVDDLAQTRADLEQVDAFETALQDVLVEAKHRERVAALQAQYDSYGLDAKIQEFLAKIDDYEPAARIIAAIVAAEEDALTAWALAVRTHQRLIEAGVDRPMPVHPDVAAGRPMRGYMSLCKMVRLPGAYGAPYVGFSHRFETQTKTIMVVDKEHPSYHSIYNSTDTAKPPLPTKLVYVDEKVCVGEPVNDDAPIWPANSNHAAWRNVENER